MLSAAAATSAGSGPLVEPRPQLAKASAQTRAATTPTTSASLTSSAHTRVLLGCPHPDAYAPCDHADLNQDAADDASRYRDPQKLDRLGDGSRKTGDDTTDDRD